MRSALLETHRDQYVAIHEGKVIGSSGDDKVAAALRAYALHGYLPVYVGLVCDAPRPAVRMPSPRRIRIGPPHDPVMAVPALPAQSDTAADMTVIPWRLVEALSLVQLDELPTLGFGGHIA